MGINFKKGVPLPSTPLIKKNKPVYALVQKAWKEYSTKPTGYYYLTGYYNGLGKLDSWLESNDIKLEWQKLIKAARKLNK